LCPQAVIAPEPVCATTKLEVRQRDGHVSTVECFVCR